MILCCRRVYVIKLKIKSEKNVSEKRKISRAKNKQKWNLKKRQERQIKKKIEVQFNSSTEQKYFLHLIGRRRRSQISSDE